MVIKAQNLPNGIFNNLVYTNITIQGYTIVFTFYIFHINIYLGDK